MTRRMIAPLAFGIAGVAILVWLGVWQLQRLAWKTEILDRIETRLAAAPVAVPAAPDPAADAYLSVAATGTIEPGELRVYVPAPPGSPEPVGYRIVVPFRLADGRAILLDRGFAPESRRDAPRFLGPVAVTGNLVWPQETDWFTSPPDRGGNLWFARDVPLMAEALGTDPVMLVVRESDPDALQAMPVTVNIPNDHLQYAVTWFLLALVWALMTGYLLWRIKRRTD